MMLIRDVDNTRDIPTSKKQVYILITADDEHKAEAELRDCIIATLKQIGAIYRFAGRYYYCEVVA